MDSRRQKAARALTSSEAGVAWLVSELPPCLIMDILSRLPIKTLFNCRSVCKTWLHFISDPFFIKLQLSRSPNCMLIQSVSPVRESKKLQFAHIEEKVINNVFTVDKMKFVPKINLPNSSFELVNSLNGMLCLAQGFDGGYCRNIYVCNPILGDYITIPVPNQCAMYGKFFAFGFSAKSNQFKVLHTFRPERKLDIQSEAEIYTLGSGQWRSIGKDPYELRRLDFNCFVNGSVHWVHFNNDDACHDIGSFNFESEQFSLLSLPPHRDGNVGDVNITVLESCLCVSLSTCSLPENFEIWVMKEYGVKESWTKQLAFKHSDSIFPDMYHPLMFLNNGLLILMVHNVETVMCYNTKKRSFQDTRISQTGGLIHTIAYNPSFVSLKDVVKGEQLKLLR